MNMLLVKIDDETKKQVDALTRAVGKPEEDVLRDVVKAGLKTYHKTASLTKGIRALLELAEWAEKNNVTGPKDLSANHNKYAWDE
jgi:predicted transcriptional regulator